jgi:hypothetical protein
MPKAHEIATELRKLADALDANPEMEHKKPWVWFYAADTKQQFLNAVSVIPRPFKKSDTDPNSKYNKIQVEYVSPTIDLLASVYKSLTCELVEPAKPAVYRCDPILSALEEAQLEGSDATV